MLRPPAAFRVLLCYIPMDGDIAAFKDYNIFSGLVSNRWLPPALASGVIPSRVRENS
ncbi:MAG: hypothetical protein LBB86_02640 [Oscillospiraceae bacterium]|nr:hypothetical protein [Oscillospiraceae bacterium]